MNCICGCGATLGRDQLELNLLAGEVAVELVVWDKARALGLPVAAAEVEALIAAGAPRYQGLVTALHENRDLGSEQREWVDEWLLASRSARRRLHRELPVPKRKVSLSAAEQAQINRRHPERSFSGGEADQAGQRGDASELEALLVVALADVRAGRPEEAKRTLRRFLSEGS